MNTLWLLGVLLGAAWGCIWAATLQWTPWGRWLAIRRTWLSVVIGVGVDLAILLPLLGPDLWWQMATVIAASSVGVIARSLANEHREDAG